MSPNQSFNIKLQNIIISETVFRVWNADTRILTCTVRIKRTFRNWRKFFNFDFACFNHVISRSNFFPLCKMRRYTFRSYFFNEWNYRYFQRQLSQLETKKNQANRKNQVTWPLLRAEKSIKNPIHAQNELVFISNWECIYIIKHHNSE